MRGKAEKKVLNGKLVKVRIEFNERIERIRILGDFFLHPEESILEIEKSIIGKKTNEDFEKIIQNTLKEKNIQLLGVNAVDIAETIIEAIANA